MLVKSKQTISKQTITKHTFGTLEVIVFKTKGEPTVFEIEQTSTINQFENQTDSIEMTEEEAQVFVKLVLDETKK